MDDDGDDKDDTKRRTRNLSEKKRRDQFNMLVSELGSMISSSNRRMDKSTVLKSTISFLRNHNEVTVRSRVHDVQGDWKPTFLVNEEFTYLTLEALEAFVLVCYPNGQICYVSESITSLLGHNPRKMLNTNLFDLAYQDDRQNLYEILHSTTFGGESSHITAPDEEILFQCHLQRGTLDIRHNANYELIQFHGHFRMNIDPHDDERSGFHIETRSRLVKRELLFVCTGRLSTPHLIRDVSLMDLNRSEFTSRHSLEWKFLFLDHRAPPIIGYLPFEVLGTSGYDYYHFDDVEKLMSCHEALIQKGELTSCYYRFLTKGQEWIWLQTRFYITYHQWNAKPEFIVCTHRVVNCAGINKGTKQEDGETDHGVDSESNEVRKNTNSDMSSISPSSYMGESSEAYSGSYQSFSQPSSVKSASGSTSGGTATASGSCVWSRVTPQACFNTESDTTSLSSDSRSSQRHSSRDSHKVVEPILVPQHVIGAQYLHPAPYVAAISVPSVLARPAVPIVVTHDQAQIQEQLQRKHEELQQMIVRQQEELRQVKEQLFLARLGILQPIINYHEEIPPTQRVPAQLLYEELQNRNNMGYQQYPPSDGNNQQQNPQMPR